MTDRCEIYVKGVEDWNALVPLVESAVGGQSDGTSVTSLTKRKTCFVSAFDLEDERAEPSLGHGRLTAERTGEFVSRLFGSA